MIGTCHKAQITPERTAVAVNEKRLASAAGLRGMYGGMLPNMWLLLLLCVFAPSVAAQQDSARDDAKALILEVRKKVMLTVDRLPNISVRKQLNVLPSSRQ